MHTANLSTLVGFATGSVQTAKIVSFVFGLKPTKKSETTEPKTSYNHI